MVSWDRNKLKKLKRTYNKARKASEDIFEFEEPVRHKLRQVPANVLENILNRHILRGAF